MAYALTGIAEGKACTKANEYFTGADSALQKGVMEDTYRYFTNTCDGKEPNKEQAARARDAGIFDLRIVTPH
jgi:hypothetical protein